MRDTVFLVVNRKGVRRMVKSHGSLQRGERAVRLTVIVPDAAFTDPPVREVVVSIPSEAVEEIPAEVEVVPLPNDLPTDAAVPPTPPAPTTEEETT